MARAVLTCTPPLLRMPRRLRIAASTSPFSHLPAPRQLGHPGEGTEGATCSCRQPSLQFKDVLDGSLGIGFYFYSLYINATKV